MPEAMTPGLSAASENDYGNPDPLPEWQRVDWRRHLRRVALPGADVGYVEIGEGEPLLFVHGISGSWQSWLENLSWFARRHRVIAPDLPGFGSSPMPSWPIEMPAYGRLVHDLSEKLGLGPDTTIVGNSLGGFVAAEAVTTAPDRFRRLVLVSAAGIINTWAPEQRAVVTGYAWKTLSPVFARRSREVVARPRLRQAVFGRTMRFPDRLSSALLYEQISSGLTHCPGFGDALRAAIGHDLRDRLGSIELPTMLVWGFDDRIIPVQAALSYRRRIPRARLEIFERTGHVPQLERPARFNALLEEFLAS
jgi:pimeloyl-ACP methyl ester carboxylesterase